MRKRIIYFVLLSIIGVTFFLKPTKTFAIVSTFQDPKSEFTYDSEAYNKCIGLRQEIKVTVNKVFAAKGIGKGDYMGRCIVRSYYLLAKTKSDDGYYYNTVAFEFEVDPVYLPDSKNNFRTMPEKVIIGFNTPNSESRLLEPNVDKPNLKVQVTNGKATKTILNFGVGIEGKLQSGQGKEGKTKSYTQEKGVNGELNVGFGKEWTNSVSNSTEICVNGVKYENTNINSDGYALWTYDFLPDELRAYAVGNPTNSKENEREKIGVDSYFCSTSFHSGQVTYKTKSYTSETNLTIDFSYDVRFGAVAESSYGSTAKNHIFTKNNSPEIGTTGYIKKKFVY